MTTILLNYCQQPRNQFIDKKPLLIQSKNTRTKASKTVPQFPPEIIRIILGLLKNDKKTLAACSLVNHTFNLHVTSVLYRTVSFTFPHTFTQFANVTNGVSYRSTRIKHLDLSGLSSIGLQKSQVSMESCIKPQDLIKILRTCPKLEAFSVSDSLESVITLDVLKTLAIDCKSLKTLDFTGFSSKQFSLAMNALISAIGRVQIVQHDDDLQYGFKRITNPALAHIKRLSLHECPVLSEHLTILSLLGHAPNLQQLDLSGCTISDMVLKFLATETNALSTLTHLSVAKCKNLSSDAIATFVSQCTQLEHLNLYGNPEIPMAISEWDLVTILNSPATKNLCFLDIGSSHITPRVLHAIQDNCSNKLQNLGLGSAEIPSILTISTFLSAMPQLQYIDLTNIACLNPLNTNGLISKINKDPINQLHTIEMSQWLLKKLHPVQGWKIDQNYGRRWYYARQNRVNIPRADRVHSRKLDVKGDVDQMSKIFQYYSYGL